MEDWQLLLDNGADIEQRGINDWTPLHCAAAANGLAASGPGRYGRVERR